MLFVLCKAGFTPLEMNSPANRVKWEYGNLWPHLNRVTVEKRRRAAAVQDAGAFSRRRPNRAKRLGLRQPSGALDFCWQASPRFHSGLLSAAPPALGPAGFEAHANGRKRFEPVSSTMGSQRDEVKFMPPKWGEGFQFAFRFSEA
jgi:hypothetical protein